MATETVAQAITDIRNEFPNMDGLSEVDVKSFVIERILWALDWEQTRRREVKKEYPVGKDRVDYALNPNSPTMVFVEAKKPGVNFDKPAQQLLKYCFQEAVNLAVLTDGRRWWLYLPEYKGPQGKGLHWSERRFSEIDITDRKRKPTSIQAEFEKFLAKEKVASSQAIEDAQSEIDKIINDKIAEKGMTEAWNNIVTTAPDDLIKLLTESTASLCNVKPSKKIVTGFFQSHRAQFKVSDARPLNPKPDTNGGGRRQRGSWLFTFLDEKQTVETWKNILPELCKLIYDRHQDTFDQKIVNIRGRKNLYFSGSPHELGNPLPIGDSSIFAATAPNAWGVEQRCRLVLRAFGYNPEDCFRIERS